MMQKGSVGRGGGGVTRGSNGGVTRGYNGVGVG